VLRILTLSNNPRLQGPSNGDLPSWLQPSRDYVFFEQFFGCPQLRLTSRSDCMYLLTCRRVSLEYSRLMRRNHMCMCVGCVVWVVASVSIDPTYYHYALCSCSAGFTGVPPLECLPCPEFATCSTEFIANEHDDAILTNVLSFPSGLYPVTESTQDNRTVVVGLEECEHYDYLHSPCNPDPAQCFYTWNGLASNCSSLCESGYTDRLCSRCVWSDDGERWYPSGEACAKCGDGSQLAFSIELAALVALVLSAVVCVFLRQRALLLLIELGLLGVLLSLGAGEWWMIDLVVLLFVLQATATHELSSGTLKSLFFFLQTTTSLTSSVWPQQLLYTSHLLALSGLQFAGLNCFVPTTSIVVTFVLQMLVPLVLSAALAAFFLAAALMAYAYHAVVIRATHHRSRTLKSYLINGARRGFFALLVVMNASYFELANEILEVLPCEVDSHSGLAYSEVCRRCALLFLSLIIRHSSLFTTDDNHAMVAV